MDVEFNAVMIDFQLTPHDKSTSLWLRLSTHLTEMLAEARTKNDSEMTEQQTAALRGRIKCLKSIIALGDDRPIILTGDDEAP